MKLTSKGRYAVTAMLDLALHAEYKPVCLADISARQDISLSYLEQLFARLRRQGLVNSARGPGGGYQLAKSASDITIAMIIQAVDESVDARKCRGTGNCQSGRRCLTHVLWHDLSHRISDFLSQITISELITNKDILQIAGRQFTPMPESVPINCSGEQQEPLSISQ